MPIKFLKIANVFRVMVIEGFNKKKEESTQQMQVVKFRACMPEY